MLRAERAALVDYTDRFFYDLKNDLMSGALQRLKELNISINNQKDENANLQKEIVSLKKEMSQTQQLVIMVNKRLTNVEEAVGRYDRKNKSKKKNATLTSTMVKQTK
jgi:septal ring factor EnvC (AmiA/AmiB activator)